jgi:hypothetical protein
LRLPQRRAAGTKPISLFHLGLEIRQHLAHEFGVDLAGRQQPAMEAGGFIEQCLIQE